MLWAQFQPQNEAEAAGFFVGVMMAGLISGGIPFFTGLALKQVSLGVGLGIVSALAGALAGCCLGFPLAIVFTIIIVVVANMSGGGTARLQHPSPEYDDYDDFARGLPNANPEPTRRPARRETERRRETDDDLGRRASDDEHFRTRGFRPRRRTDDQDT